MSNPQINFALFQSMESQHFTRSHGYEARSARMKRSIVFQPLHSHHGAGKPNWSKTLTEAVKK